MESIDRFKKYFSKLDFGEESILKHIYASDIIFKDPIHEIHGIEQLTIYFQKLNSNLIEGSFQFTNESIFKNKAYLTWEMNLKLKSPKKSVYASGISVLFFDNKITYQRDYFDAGELFYEQIPILGRIIRIIKKNLANK